MKYRVISSQWLTKKEYIKFLKQLIINKQKAIKQARQTLKRLEK